MKWSCIYHEMELYIMKWSCIYNKFAANGSGSLTEKLRGETATRTKRSAQGMCHQKRIQRSRAKTESAYSNRTVAQLVNEDGRMRAIEDREGLCDLRVPARHQPGDWAAPVVPEHVHLRPSGQLIMGQLRSIGGN